MVSYEEQVTTIREQLAELLEDEEEWAKAAKVLAGIDLDSGQLAEHGWALLDHFPASTATLVIHVNCSEATG